jgi:glycosyltransferase involved in cell wall biosynthesis
MIRIGIDASNIRAGGGLTHLKEILSALSPEEHKIERVIVWGGKSTLMQLPVRDWLDLTHVPFLDKSLIMRLWWAKLRIKELAEVECDILFFPGASYSTSFKPYVSFSQNLLPFDVFERKRYGISLAFLRVCMLRFTQGCSFRKCDGVIFLTNHARTIVLKAFPKLNCPTATIPHGVNPVFFHPPAKQLPLKDFSSKNPFRFLYVSIIDMYKHQWKVVEAVSLLRAKGYPVILNLVGPAYPPALRRLQNALARFDPQREFVFYHGSIPYGQLHDRYRNADGFIFASTCETFGMILLEAMASGLPIACSDYSPLKETLGNFGMFFSPEDPSNIASVLSRLIEERNLRERCAWAAHKRAKTYSWERCAYETFSFIAEVARNERR